MNAKKQKKELPSFQLDSPRYVRPAAHVSKG